jgi:hypothetical protein
VKTSHWARERANLERCQLREEEGEELQGEAKVLRTFVFLISSMSLGAKKNVTHRLKLKFWILCEYMTEVNSDKKWCPKIIIKKCFVFLTIFAEKL